MNKNISGVFTGTISFLNPFKRHQKVTKALFWQRLASKKSACWCNMRNPF